MNTKYLVTFKTILEMGSFQKAAEKLNYTQSTVTFQMKQMEEELSIKLFEKIGRKMELTQAGKDIIPYVNSVLDEVEKLNNYGKELSEIKGVLKLAIPDSILIYNMQPVIQEFLRRAPKVQLSIISMQSGEINQAIQDGVADIGINCEKNSYPDSVVHKRLGSYKAMLIASPSFNQNELDFITSNQRKNFSMICNEPDGFYQLEMDKYFEKKNIILNPKMKVQSIEAVKQCVINNLGIAVVPSYAIADELEKGVLIQIKTEIDDTEYLSTYTYHKNRWLNPQMKLAIQILIDLLGVSQEDNESEIV